MKVAAIAVLLLVAAAAGLFADCIAEIDCFTQCNTPYYLSCKCYTGPRKCQECTCTSPTCLEMGACCCTRQDGSQSCTQVDRCGGGWLGSLPGELPAGREKSVEAVNRPGMPELSRLSFAWSDHGAGSGSYIIRNPDNTGLIALEISWYFRTTMGVVRVATWVDNWLAGTSYLPAGLSAHETFDAYVAARSGAVRDVVAVVSYAEFQDGRRVGEPDRARLVSERRRQIREAYVRYRDAFNAGGSQGLAEALKSAPRQTPSGQAARTRLRQILREGGVEAALADISRLLSLPH
jgi:hypothetical protein